jgi:hypothetical protein
MSMQSLLKGSGPLSPSLGFFEAAPVTLGISKENKRPVSETAMPRPIAADICVEIGRCKLNVTPYSLGSKACGSPAVGGPNS